MFCLCTLIRFSLSNLCFDNLSDYTNDPFTIDVRFIALPARLAMKTAVRTLLRRRRIRLPPWRQQWQPLHRHQPLTFHHRVAVIVLDGEKYSKQQTRMTNKQTIQTIQTNYKLQCFPHYLFRYISTQPRDQSRNSSCCSQLACQFPLQVPLSGTCSHC
jgi:hypothetical protein